MCGCSSISFPYTVVEIVAVDSSSCSKGDKLLVVTVMCVDVCALKIRRKKERKGEEEEDHHQQQQQRRRRRRKAYPVKDEFLLLLRLRDFWSSTLIVLLSVSLLRCWTQHAELSGDSAVISLEDTCSYSVPDCHNSNCATR